MESLLTIHATFCQTNSKEVSAHHRAPQMSIDSNNSFPHLKHVICWQRAAPWNSKCIKKPASKCHAEGVKFGPFKWNLQSGVQMELKDANKLPKPLSKCMMFRPNQQKDSKMVGNKFLTLANKSQQRQTKSSWKSSCCHSPQIHQPWRNPSMRSIQETHCRAILQRLQIHCCLWLQQCVREFNCSLQSQMQQHWKSAHRKHTTKVQSQNTTTPQWSPKACQT